MARAAVAAMKSQKLLAKARPAVSVVCPGCEQECVMPVHTLPAGPRGPASFIFCDKRSDIQRAYRAWPILIGCASKNAPITRGDLASKLGVHHRVIRYVLGVIQDCCLAQQLPPLATLVINGETRMPSSGFVAWDMDDLDRGRAEVHAFPWQTLDNPFAYAADGSNRS
jgi:hypothetical protein